MRSSPRCAQVSMNNLVNWLVEKKVSGLPSVPCVSLLHYLIAVVVFTRILGVDPFTQSHALVIP